MTREEAIKILNDEEIAYLVGKFHGGKEALDLALSALRPVSREQVEKVWRGEWERITDPYGKLEGFLCKCGTQTYSASNFCPNCGDAKTDEAVDMVMERLEALKDGSKTD